MPLLQLPYTRLPLLSSSYFISNNVLKSNSTENECMAIATELLRQIIKEHSANNRIFILPWADELAIHSSLFPFKEFIKQGVKAEFLLDACVKKENLFRTMTRQGQQTYQMILILVDNFAMTFEDALRFFSSWSDELSKETPESVQRRLSVFLGRGISAGNQLKRIILKCPELLFSIDAQKMDICFENISNYFQNPEINRLMHETPHICLLNPRELEYKYEYIYYHMGIESSELVESKQWMNMELDQIINRHQLLTKTGKYIIPDPKKPQYKKENPSAKVIFDSPDQTFSTEIAGVSNEEWIIFQDICEREKLMEDKERPFERIKPSKRKAYERRIKNKREKEEGEIAGPEY